MKRIAALAALAALLVTTGAFARTASSPPTMHANELTVAFGDPAVNFASGTVRGSTYLHPKGYEVDLANAIAKKLGIANVKFVYTPWNGLFAPGRKKFDISFQEATITAQRKKTVDFSASYFDANQGILLSKKAKVPHSLNDLKGLQTCAQSDTTGLQYIQQRLHPKKTPLIYQSTSAAFTAVQVNRCEALVLDTPIVASEKKARPSSYGVVGGQIITHEQYGAVLPKNSKLTPSVSSAVNALWKDGTISKLQKKWFNVDFSKVPVLK